MSKVTKKMGKMLLHSLTGVVLVAILLVLVVALAFSLPRVQTFVASKATEYLTEQTGMHVSVESISIEHLSELVAERVYIEDLEGDTLIYANRLTGHIDRKALLGEASFRPSNIFLQDASLYIKTPNSGESNITEFINRVTALFPEDTTKKNTPFVLRGLRGENLHFKLYDERSVGRVPEGAVDYSDMDIQIATACFDSIVLKKGVVVFHGASNINAVDKSGGYLENSAFGMLEIPFGSIHFRDVDFRSGESRLQLPYLTISGPDWKSYSDFYNNVTLSLESAGTILEPATAGRFVPALGTFAVNGRDITGTFEGTVNDFFANISANLYDSDILFRGEVKDLTHLQEMTARAYISLASTPEKVKNTYASILQKPLSQGVAQWIEPFDSLAFAGRLSVVPETVTITDGHLATDLGNVEINGALTYGNNGIAFDGDISGNDVQVGQIASLKALGATDFAMNGKVGIRGGNIEGDIAAEIESIVLGTYEYNNIELEASMNGSTFAAHAISADPNFTFEVDGDGSLGSKESAPEYNLMLSLEKADFEAMGLSRREGNSLLSGNIEARVTGRTLDDMVGRAMINNLFYATATDTLSTEIVNISLRGGDSDKSFSLSSPILDIDYNSSASYSDVMEYLTKTIPAALPLIGDAVAENVAEHAPLGNRLYTAEDYSNISVKVIEGDHLASVFLPGAKIASKTSLEMEFSPAAQEFSLTLGSDNLTVGNIVADNLTINAGGVGTSLNLEAAAQTLKAAGANIPDVNINAEVGNGDNLTLELLVSNSDAALSGRLGVDATLSRNKSGEVIASATLSDSYLLSPSQRWTLDAQDIRYTPREITIDHFSANAGVSHIDINGVISTSNKSPLMVTLDDIVLGEWVSLLGNMNDMEGSVSGNLELYSALDEIYGEGTLSLSTISAGGVDIDPMELEVVIPRLTTEASATLTNTHSRTTLAEGRYDYRSGEYDAQITIDELQLSTLYPLFKGVLEDINGEGEVALNITGERSDYDINGRVSIKALHTKVGFTGAEYTIPTLALNIENNKGSLSPARIEDKEGGWALVDGNIALESGSPATFSLSLEPHNLIAIDIAEDRERSFYGKVYASSGGVKLSAEDSAIVINGGLRTGNNSIFNLPLKGNNDFAGADFVTFVNHSSESDIDFDNSRNDNNEESAEKSLSNLIVDMMLGVDTTTQLRLIIDPETDNVIEAKGDAELGITLDSRKDEFAIRGDYQISEGVYNFNFQNLITKQFKINPDSYLHWNGSPLDANIDISANYRLKTSLAPLLGNESTASRASTPVDCIVKLTGNLSNVDVSFDIDVPTANTEYQSILSSYFSSQEMMATQFVYLLALGNFYSDSSTGPTTTAGTAGTAIGLDFLAAQVSKLVSNDAYKFNLQYKAIDDTSSSYSIDFQTDIIDDRLTLELEANVDTGDYYQSFGDNNNQLSGGGALTLRLDPAGNINLKGFSRTIDRFDENQGLQENGVGIYFKRSFNRLSDLWRKKNRNTEEESEKSDTFVATSPTNPNAQDEEGDKADSAEDNNE